MRSLFALAALALLLSICPSQVNAELLCAKKSLIVGSTKAKLKKAFESQHHACSAGYKELGSIHQVIASARVASGPTVVNFGGWGTTSAAVALPSTGLYRVTFTGDYPGLDSSDPFENLHRVVVLSTAQSSGYGTTSAEVISASTTEIEIEVSLIDSSVPNLQNQSGLHLVVLEADHLGQI